MTTAPATSFAEGSRSVVIVGGPTETNLALVTAFAELGCRSRVADPAAPPRVGSSEVVLARLDVLPTLDGIERGLWNLPRLRRAAATRTSCGGDSSALRNGAGSGARAHWFRR